MTLLEYTKQKNFEEKYTRDKVIVQGIKNHKQQMLPIKIGANDL